MDVELEMALCLTKLVLLVLCNGWGRPHGMEDVSSAALEQLQPGPGAGWLAILAMMVEASL